MAFPSTTGTIGQLSVQLDRAMRIATDIKRVSNDISSRSSASTLTSINVLGYLDFLTDRDSQLGEVAATPGIQQYARDQFDNQAFDIVTEFTTMRAAVIATRDWLVTNIPTGANQVVTIAGGVAVYRVFTDVETAGLRTEIDALLLTID